MIPAGLKTVTEIYRHYIQTVEAQTPVFAFDDRLVSAGDFRRMVAEQTGYLRGLGVSTGSMVGYALPNRPEIFSLFLALSNLGACAIPVFHQLPDAAKAATFSRMGASIVITTAALYPALFAESQRQAAAYLLVTIDPQAQAPYFSVSTRQTLPLETLTPPGPDLAMLMATSSGTTGIPKTVRISQGNVASEIYVSLALSRSVSDQPYRTLIAFPLSTSAITVLLGSLFAGICQVFSADISPPHYLRLLEKWRPAGFTAPPSYFEAFIGQPGLAGVDCSCIKFILTGMDFFTPALLARVKAKWPSLERFTSGYGLIETSNVMMLCPIAVGADDVTNRMELVPGLGNKMIVRTETGDPVTLGEAGELTFQGPNVVAGYPADPVESAACFVDGWFRTGDIVRLEAEASVTLLGRKKYLIKRGGKSVSPIVVQNQLNRLAGIRDSAVVGVPHPLYGEMTWAFVVRASPGAPGYGEIMRHCRESMANYMVPDHIVFIPDIPRNPGVGKVNFEKLREMAGLELAAMGGQQ